MVKIKRDTSSSNRKSTSYTPGMIRITPMTELSVEGMKILIYGASKTGKTTLCGSHPGRKLCIVPEHEVRGLKSLQDVQSEVDLCVLEDPYDLEKVLDSLEENDPYADGGLKFLDNLDALYQQLMANVIGLSSTADLLEVVPDKDDYNKVAAALKNFCLKLCRLKGDVALIGQERTYNTTDQGEGLQPFIGTGPTDAIKRFTDPLVDYIVRTFIDEHDVLVKYKDARGKVREKVKSQKDYALLTGPHPIYKTGFRKPRSGIIPDVVYDPTFEKLKKIADGLWEEKKTR